MFYRETTENRKITSDEMLHVVGTGGTTQKWERSLPQQWEGENALGSGKGLGAEGKKKNMKQRKQMDKEQFTMSNGAAGVRGREE